jgi:hypothetical protein
MEKSVFFVIVMSSWRYRESTCESVASSLRAWFGLISNSQVAVTVRSDMSGGSSRVQEGKGSCD